MSQDESKKSNVSSYVELAKLAREIDNGTVSPTTTEVRNDLRHRVSSMWQEGDGPITDDSAALRTMCFLLFVSQLHRWEGFDERDGADLDAVANMPRGSFTFDGLIDEMHSYITDDEYLMVFMLLAQRLAPNTPFETMAEILENFNF